jgi:hypothetical protein
MTSDGDDTNTPADGPPPRPGLLDTYRSWPQWARIMAPVAAVILGLALASGLSGGARESDSDTLAAASTTTVRDEPREPSTTEAPTTAPPTTAAPTTVPPTLPPTTPPPTTPTTAPPTTAAPPPAPAPAPAPAPSPGPVSYANCSEARAAGVTPLHRGDPGYAQHLDRDNDGIACE